MLATGESRAHDERASCPRRHGGTITHNRRVAEVRPFRGLRYDDAKAGRLADLLCPPYDVISEELRTELYARSPYNFVRVEYARDEPSADRYAVAARSLAEWTAAGTLRRDAKPAFYGYDHVFVVDGAKQLRRGFFCALKLHALDEGVVVPHELTFPKAKADRLELLRRTRTNTSAVFAIYADDDGAIASLLARARKHAVGDARQAEERHTIWTLDDDRAANELRERLKNARIYIADGHHRYETALAYRAEDKSEGARFVLAYLCALNDPGLRIFATHRVVQGDGALERAADRFFTRAPIDAGAIADIQPGIALAHDSSLTQLAVRPDADLSALPPTWRSLPVAQAEELLLREVRDAGAEVTYEHDTARAIAAAKGGATAVLLRAIDPQTLRRVADAGERLPQKTTYFYPKVAAGLVIRSLEEK
ncbi:MAG: DUF1015 domain-containing protein [Chloroflexi bacterium]|nr:MAG: DUF1015 domain-containing protein [Chloroflexota bacterium]